MASSWSATSSRSFWFPWRRIGDAHRAHRNRRETQATSPRRPPPRSPTRAYRAEQRARADLQALVDTSPVGVLVFDAESGRAVSFNREARRIAESLRQPGRPPEQVLELLSFRRADGSVVSLSELPIKQLIHSGETMRAEEVVLSVPDGRSVRTLVNASPIRAEGDAISSLVITVQDLAPLDEIERLRTEFLGLVSRTEGAAGGHQGIGGDAAGGLGGARPGRDARVPPHRRRAGQPHAGPDQRPARCGPHRLGRALGLAGTLGAGRAGGAGAGHLRGRRRAARHRCRPSRRPAPRDGRPPAHRAGAEQPFANAAKHAPESSPVRVAALRAGGHVAVSVSDEGRGVAPELLPRLFDKHARAGSKAGYGLGLAICKSLVDAHGGRIRAESAGPGLGTTVTFALPVAGETGAEAAAARPATGRESAHPGGRRRPRTLRSVRDTLSAAGYAPLVTGEPRKLALIIRAEKPRLVLLDLVLPGQDGIALMEQVPELSDLPVIFISGYGRDETVAAALEAGAADYIVKPLSPIELARVRAALRRHEEPGPFVLGDLAIDYGRRRVSVAGNPATLTATGFELLRVLALNAGRVVTRNAAAPGQRARRRVPHARTGGRANPAVDTSFGNLAVGTLWV